MYGYSGRIQVKAIVENQEKYLSEQLDEVLKVMEQNVNELEKLAAEFDALIIESES